MDDRHDVYENRPAWKSIPVIVVTARDLSSAERQLLHGKVERILQTSGFRLDELAATGRDSIAAGANRTTDLPHSLQ